jgi:5-methylthioadenosine/S-adenosylhomocysteine deaminase
VIDAQGMLLMPGLINAHTHSGQSLDRGFAPCLPLDLWMIWAVFGAVEPTPDDTYALVAAGALEMLRGGVTSVLDQPSIVLTQPAEHIEAIMSAYADVGMRAGVALMLQDRDFLQSLPLHLLASPPDTQPMFPPRDPHQLAEILARYLERWMGRHPRLQPMLGPSAPQRCSDEFLSIVSELARSYQGRVHMHLMESKSQVFAAEARYGRSVLEHLGDLGLLGPHASFAHGVWLSGEEYGSLKSSGSTLVYNPVSNLRCGSGVLPLQYLMEIGLEVAVGTDGAASNDNQNMFEALKFGTLLQTLYGSHQTWPQAIELWTASLGGGAAALDLPIGSLSPGSFADLVLLTLDRHALGPKETLVSSLVFAEHGESVHSVFVAGERVVDEGRATRVSERDVFARAKVFRERALEGWPRRQEVFASVEPLISEMLRVVDHTELSARRLADVDLRVPQGTLEQEMGRGTQV